MKGFILIIIAVLMIGIIGVAYSANANIKNISVNSGIGQELNQQIAEKRTEYKSGNFTTSLGQFLNVKEMVAGMKELREGNVIVNTKLSLTKVENGRSKIEVGLRNGNHIELKIMPSIASEIALQRLRIKVCNETNNCIIELKEVPTGNGNGKIEYDVQIERHSKLLGIFEKKMKVNVEVDAETGNVISENRPWWAFIATESVE